jgi:carbamoyltransferase
MRVLGISDGMTGGAALIEHGKILYAIHEERLTRAKMATGFPRESICAVLRDTHTKAGDIDAIAVATVNEFFREKAVAYDGWFVREQSPLKEVLLTASSHVTRHLGTRPFLQQSYYRLKSFLGKARRRAIGQLLRQEWDFTCPIKFIDHHFAHACSAYFTAGLDDSTVITMDGAGDYSSSRVYFVADGKFQQLCNIDSFNSIGNYYGYITHICGFKAHKHEGKITGLAAYGKPAYTDILKRFITYQDGETINKGQVFYWAAVRAIEKALPSSFKREDVAASMQQVLEEIGCSYVQHWMEKTGCRNLALAGGVFANVKLNQSIHELENVRSLFIHPGMGDEGLAVGAAFALSHALSKTNGAKVSSSALGDVYFGPSFSATQIEKAIVKEGLPAEYTDNIERRIAELLAQGHVVARFGGRMEYGPRALGNRSILYQATDSTVNNWLNTRLKRTEFMPFAPVTLEEFADQCYENLAGARYPAQFMTITFKCTDWMRKHCPAVVHVDGTARPQIINQKTNPGYYKIVDEYRKMTGLPSLINTSFNMHEEPIVCSPSDALRVFMDGGLDYLAMGNYVLEHPRRLHSAEPVGDRTARYVAQAL